MTNRCGTCHQDIQPHHMGIHLAEAHSVGDVPGAAWILTDMAVTNPYRLKGLKHDLERVLEDAQDYAANPHTPSYSTAMLIQDRVDRGLLTAWEAELVGELLREKIEAEGPIVYQVAK